MSRSRWILAFCLAVAVWMSDRWMWTLPALLGVISGTLMSRPSRTPAANGHDTSGSPLGALLVLVSFVYLYLTFLIFQIKRLHDLFALEGTADRPSVLFLIGVVALSLLLLGLGGILLFRMKIPQWLSKMWEQLVEER